jgi:DNA-binding response OmpR family regulator
MNERILVVEDTEAILDAVTDALAAEGFEVQGASDGLAALELAQAEPFDLVILDLMLPGLSGTEVCRRLRTESPVPIIMLTARDSEADRVLGLEIGADDYVTKPFSIRELLARVKAFLRRQTADPAYEFGDFRLDLVSHKLFRMNKEVELTAKEFRLLEFFVKRAGRALTRDSILDAVWGDEVMVTDRSVDRCVTTLRGKIESDSRHPEFIQTIRDIGYRFETHDEKSNANL